MTVKLLSWLFELFQVVFQVSSFGVPINDYLISTPSGETCHLTPISSETAFAPLHCGYAEWRVGTQLYGADGRFVGTISQLGDRLPITQDAVKIDLASGLISSGERISVVSEPNPEGVFCIRGSDSNECGQLLSEAYLRSSLLVALYPERVFLKSSYTLLDVRSNFGDSGSPIVDSYGSVAGMLIGGDGLGRTFFIPVPILCDSFGIECSGNDVNGFASSLGQTLSSGRI